MPKSPHGYDTKSWNPTTGCSKVSAGCKHCWAEEYSRRMGWPWKVTLHTERLEQPFGWRGHHVIATAFMGDLFHDDVPEPFLGSVFQVMRIASQHTFLVLTKRAQRMMNFLRGAGEYEATNVYLGVSLEDQATADERIPLLVRMKAEGAAVRIWVSFEPLLQDITINYHLFRQLDWAVIGGESGPKARPMKIPWMAQLASQCATLGVPCYVKQDSHRYPGRQGRIPDALWARKQVPW